MDSWFLGDLPVWGIVSREPNNMLVIGFFEPKVFLVLMNSVIYSVDTYYVYLHLLSDVQPEWHDISICGTMGRHLSLVLKIKA